MIQVPVITQSRDWLDNQRQWQPDIVDITELPSLSLLVVDHRGPMDELPATVERLIEQRRAFHLHPDNSRTFNLNYQQQPDNNGHWHLGLAAEIPADRKAAVNAGRLPDGFRCHLFGAGEYARIRVQGGDAGLIFAVRWLLDQWLPDSGYELAEGIILFERVQFPPMVEPEQALVDVLVPVEQAI